jgi:hypothetical protein
MIYEHLTDTELDAKKRMLAEKYEEAMGGGVAIVIAGEGRRVEYTRANADGLLSLMKAVDLEQRKRRGEQVSGAISVTFPYGGDFCS